MIGFWPLRGMPTQKGAVENVRSTPPNGATSTLPRTLTKWIETRPSRRRHLGPFADAADMAGIFQRDRRKPHRLAFLDAERHRLRRRGLAEAILPVEDRQHRRVDHALHRLVGEEHAVLLPFHVARRARDAVAVMACKIGADEIFSDPPALLLGAAGGDENVGDEVRQRVGGNARHVSARPRSDCAGCRRLRFRSRRRRRRASRPAACGHGRRPTACR